MGKMEMKSRMMKSYSIEKNQYDNEFEGEFQVEFEGDADEIRCRYGRGR